MNKPNQFQFEWITDWETINSDVFQQKWLNWCVTAVNSHVFFHPTLANVWIKSYKTVWKISPLFAIATKNNTIIFFPLVHIRLNARSFFKQIIAPVGYSSFDYCDPLIIGDPQDYSSQFFEEFYEELKAFNYDSLELKGLHIENLNKPNLKAIVEKCYYSEINDLADGANSLLLLMTPKNRREHLRVERRLKELGDISFEVITGIDSLFELEFENFIRNYKIRWPNAFFANDFHKLLLKACIEQKLVWFSQLKLDGNSIGWAIDFLWKDRCYAYMHCYDKKYISYAPGRTHLIERLKLASSSGVKYFDLLTGSEPYKSEWFQDFEEIYSYTLSSEKSLSQLKNKLNILKSKLK